MGGMPLVVKELSLPTIFHELLEGNLNAWRYRKFTYPRFGQTNRSNRMRQWLRPQQSKYAALISILSNSGDC
jgi:hypothetical protein